MSFLINKELTAREASEQSFVNFKRFVNQHIQRTVNDGKSALEFNLDCYSDSFVVKMTEYLKSRGFGFTIEPRPEPIKKAIIIFW